jgi:hypothetical protein
MAQGCMGLLWRMDCVPNGDRALSKRQAGFGEGGDDAIAGQLAAK